MKFYKYYGKMEWLMVMLLIMACIFIGIILGTGKLFVSHDNKPNAIDNGYILPTIPEARIFITTIDGVVWRVRSESSYGVVLSTEPISKMRMGSPDLARVVLDCVTSMDNIGYRLVGIYPSVGIMFIKEQE